jgi:flagellum-specific peptidoglycan hydrolase FlgJ
MFYNTYLRDLKTESEYYGYLQQYYAEDPNYVERLKNIINNKKLKEKFN